MDEIARDIRRLEHITESTIALERFSVSTRMGDFVRYYFSRFLSNIKHVFREFSHSEIVAFNKRYQGQVDLLLKDPLLSIDGIIVPIPKGMVHSYKETLVALDAILTRMSVTTLAPTLTAVLDGLKRGDLSNLPAPAYSKSQFEIDKSTIGKLYTTSGAVTHITAEHALISLSETQEVNLKLSQLTTEYYPTAILLAGLVDAIDKTHSQVSVDPDHAEALSGVLMEAAYRVSIFAISLDHVQDMEHSFVKALAELRNTSERAR